MQFKVTIDTSQLESYLNRVNMNIENLDEELDRRLEMALDYATIIAKELAPIGVTPPPRDPLPHGKLMQSIRVEKRGLGSYVLIADAVNVQGDMYPEYVERGSHPGGGSYYMEPRPFMIPALEQSLEIFIDEVKDFLYDIFEVN
jgi:hypothetical protein